MTRSNSTCAIPAPTFSEWWNSRNDASLRLLYVPVPGWLTSRRSGGELGGRFRADTPPDEPPRRLDGRRARHGHREARRAADGEGELGAAPVAHPADEQRAQRREAVPGVVVDPEHAAADMVGARELDSR